MIIRDINLHVYERGQNDNKMRESDWYGFDVCVKCESRLNDSQKMYRGGVCPKCGNVAKGTVVATRKVVLKQTKHHPWWRFWNKEHTYRGRNEFSERWTNPDTKHLKLELTNEVKIAIWQIGNAAMMCKDDDITSAEYEKLSLDAINGLVNGVEKSDSTCNLQNVSGLFVLYRTNGILETFWNGTEWQQGKDNCPTYTWEKANEYAKVLGCKFTDFE